MADEIVTVDSLVNQHAAQKNASTDKPPVNDPPPLKTDDPPAPDPLKELLKEFDVENVDALREKLKPKQDAPPPVLSPEEKEKQDNLYQVDMQRYAVENGLMKPEEFQQLNNLKGKENRSLVYEQWLPSWKEENPDVPPAEADKEAQAAFEAEYGLSSSNEKTKARGEARINREAGSIRQPLETSYTKVKADFDEDRTVKADYPGFNKKVSDFIQENIPAQVTIWEGKDGEEQVPIVIDLTEDQRKDLYQKVAQKMLNSGTYQLFKKGDETQLKEIAKRQTEELLWQEHRSTGLAKVAQTFLARGKKQGSTVGAKNPFPTVQDHQKTGGKDHQSAQQEVLDSLEGKGTK